MGSDGLGVGTVRAQSRTAVTRGMQYRRWAWRGSLAEMLRTGAQSDRELWPASMNVVANVVCGPLVSAALCQDPVGAGA